MATTNSARTRRPANSLRVALITVEGLVAAAAVYGGVGLIANNAISMPSDWLAGSPFDSWQLPGVFLLLVVATPMAVAAVAELRRWSWAYPASVIAGGAQVGWILVQWIVIQRFFFLQPAMLIAGLVVLTLAILVHGRRWSRP